VPLCLWGRKLDAAESGRAAVPQPSPSRTHGRTPAVPWARSLALPADWVGTGPIPGESRAAAKPAIWSDYCSTVEQALLKSTDKRGIPAWEAT
jgi:hypothetical protein